MKTIFKKGDKVFDLEDGWGEVIDTSEILQYSISVEYGNNVHTYTADGKISLQAKFPVLSFTEYDLVNGGFSQERPLPNIEKDTLIYVRDFDTRWSMRYFSHFEGDLIYTFVDQHTSKDGTRTEPWEDYSLTNPLEKGE